MNKWKRWGTLALCLLLVLALPACKKGVEKPQSPEAYALGGDSAPTLDGLLSEGGELTAAEALDAGGTPVEETPEGSPAPTGSGAPELQVVTQYRYIYENLAAGGETAQAYAGLLTGEEYGFTPVGEDGKPTPAVPDYAASTGTVKLARQTQTEGELFQIQLDWTQTGCIVTVTRPEGTLKEEQQQGMTVSEAVDFLRSLSPAALELPGSSMGEYLVYPREGLVIADGNACIQLGVYRRTAEGTNAVEGRYLLTADKAHLYRINENTDTVTELPLRRK